MDRRSTQFSFVVVARDHNPTILNPDFLNHNTIVPLDEWGWKISAPPITTPPYAQVQYDSGVQIIAEPNRIQVIEENSTPLNSTIPIIIMQYIKTLPHVRYTGVGINFRSVYLHEQPSEYLLERFIKDGQCNDANYPLSEIGLKLNYPLSDVQLNLTVDSGEQISNQNGEKIKEKCLIVGTNFHQDLQSYPSDELVISIIEYYEDYWNKHIEVTKEIVGIDSE